MGGRGSSASWGGGGGGSAPPISTTSLISAREGRQNEVDQVLATLKDVRDQYGVTMDDVELGIFPAGSATMGYYDPSTGALGMNSSYFNSQKLDATMDKMAQTGFHPPRGAKSGMEAVAAHEAGHRINYVAAERQGISADSLANKVIEDSAKALGYTNSANMAKKISGYALDSKKECIAEAFADVYCNGNNAKNESRTIVNTLKSYL